MTRRIIAATCLSAAALLAAPAGADAKWKLTQYEAEQWAETIVSDEYGHDISELAASCRPQGMKKARRGRAYHKWTCGWGHTYTDEDGQEIGCGGQIVVAGTRRSSANYWIIRGQECDHLDNILG